MKSFFEGLRTMFQGRHTAFQQSDVLPRAGDDARHGQPRLVGDSLPRCVGWIYSFYEGMRTELFQRTQALAIAPIATAMLLRIQARLTRGIQRLPHLFEERRNLEIDRRREATSDPHPYPWNLLWFLGLSLAFLFAGQCAADFVAYRRLPGGDLWNYAFALSTGVATFWLAHLMPYLVAKGKTALQRRLIAIAFSILVIGLFSVIGKVRADVQVTPDNAQHNITMPTWGFVVINSAVFFAELCICWLYWPTKDQWVRRRRIKILERQLSQIGRAINAQERDNERDEAAQERIRIEAYGTMHEVHDLSRSITHMRDESIQLYASENVLRRHDGVPDCFNYQPTGTSEQAFSPTTLPL